MNVYIGKVINNIDPLQMGKLFVQIPECFGAPVWVPALFQPATPVAVPIPGVDVLIIERAPGSFVWVGQLMSLTSPAPEWARLEYPLRRALVGSTGVTMFGVDAAGLCYCGHFKATEAAVLGTTLIQQLQSLFTEIQNVATNAVTALTALAGAIPTPVPPSVAQITTAATAVGTLSGQLINALSILVKVAKDPTT